METQDDYETEADYIVQTTGGTYQLKADWCNASAQVYWRERETDEWETCPFNVGAVKHSEFYAADKLVSWFNTHGADEEVVGIDEC
jgi:hypothetical protein